MPTDARDRAVSAGACGLVDVNDAVDGVGANVPGRGVASGPSKTAVGLQCGVR